MKKHLAILICSQYAGTPTAKDNDVFYSALEARGLTYDLVVWDQQDVNWDNYKGVLIRATWDYIFNQKKFLTLIEFIRNKNIPVFNSIGLIRWNSKKDYLLDLQKSNIRIINSLMTTSNDQDGFNQFAKENKCDEYVIKPLISAGAHKTFRVKHNDISNTLLSHFPDNDHVIIQPFIKEILNGEWSLIYINNIYSHAVLLKPSFDDFRVQIKYGGKVELVQPTREMLAAAEKVLACLKEKPLYARVDFVMQKNKLFLMELELIEPALFFRWHPQAARNLADNLFTILFN